MKNSTFRFSALLAALIFVSHPLAANDKADRIGATDISIVVTASVGGPADTIARLVAELLSDQLMQPVVVTNRPGAGVAVAAQHVARSKPYGATILSTIIDAFLLQSLSDVSSPKLDEFRIVGVAANAYTVLYASSKHGWGSLQDFIAAAKKEPSRYSIGLIPGGTQSISSKELQRLAGISLIEVPFKGNNEIRSSIAGGHIDLAFEVPNAVSDKSKFTLLAARASTRIPEFSNVPTFKETGLDLFSFLGTYAFLVPKDTPDEIAERLIWAIGKVVASPAFQERIRLIGFNPVKESVSEYEKSLVADKETYHSLVKAYLPKVD